MPKYLVFGFQLARCNEVILDTHGILPFYCCPLLSAILYPGLSFFPKLSIYVASKAFELPFLCKNLWHWERCHFRIFFGRRGTHGQGSYQNSPACEGLSNETEAQNIALISTYIEEYHRRDDRGGTKDPFTPKWGAGQR